MIVDIFMQFLCIFKKPKDIFLQEHHMDLLKVALDFVINKEACFILPLLIFYTAQSQFSKKG